MNTTHATLEARPILEALEDRRMLSGDTMQFGETSGFSLEPAQHAGWYASFASNSAGTVVRALGKGDIAVYRGFGTDSPGSSVVTQTQAPGINSMALNERGELVITWVVYGTRKASGYQSSEVRMQVYQIGVDGTATPSTPAYSVAKVNDSWNFSRQKPVAIDQSGDVTITWGQENGYDWDIHARRYELQANGSYRAGKTFRVNTDTAGTQSVPHLAIQTSGPARDSLIIGWSDWTSNSDPTPFSTQRFDADGGRVGGQVRIIDDIDGVALAADPTNGGFVAAWQIVPDQGLTQSSGIFARRFGPSAVPLGSEFTISGAVDFPSSISLQNLAVEPGGDAVVSYTRQDELLRETVQTPEGEETTLIQQYQSLAHHYSAAADAFSSEMVVASTEARTHRIIDASGTSTITVEGNRLWLGNAVTIGGDHFLLPYEVYAADQAAVMYPVSNWYARTLVSGGSSTLAASTSLFSQSRVGDDESAFEDEPALMEALRSER